MVQVGRDGEGALEVARPLFLLPDHFLDPVRETLEELGGVGAGDPVDLDALGARHEPEHVVAEDRVAALGHLVFQSLDILGVDHQDVVGSHAGIALRRRLRHFFHSLYRALLLRGLLLLDEGLDVVDVHLLAGDGRHEREDGRILAGLEELHHPIVRELELPVAQAALQELAAVRGGLALLGVQLLLDLGAGLGRDHPAQPVAVGPLVLAGQDLHHVAGLELLADGDGLAVHASAGAMAAQAGMDVEGEVQHGGAGRQDAQLARRGEDEDLPRRRRGEVLRRSLERMLQRVADRLQPAVDGRLVADALVGPVRGVAALGLDVHPPRADLDLQGLALLVLDGDMQRLVAVGARRGEPVAQALGVGFVFFGHVGEHLPAEVLLDLGVVVALNDEADGEHVVDTLEGDLLHLHLAVDGVGALGADLQLVDDPGVGELLLQRLDKLGRDLLAVLLRGLQLVGDGAVGLGIRIAEIDVAQLVVDVVQAELVRQRHIEHQRLEELLVAGGLGEELQAAHHFQPVRDLEHGHARVRGVLDDELLVVLRLQTGVLGLDGRDLVEAVHERPHVLRERADVHILMDAGGFVEIDGSHAGVREADLVFDDPGHLVRVSDERGPVVPGLVLQCLQRHCAGFFDQIVHQDKYSNNSVRFACKGELPADQLFAARERLTRKTPPKTSTAATAFCQVKRSIPMAMLSAAAIIGWR